ncbi:hypothetical protein BU23DRAFT_602651 [Bimuria novae-zelandiae CBS 107.79]|uniref:Uncharacterized protein n=1 Tax=Bimuria novae-zelandiae CBS 107.79 TaxID=1447943 RepID=A0A6A5UUX3_9PLEO|nr:hypothetical protein BU23DRAFT_602651 [Bimuria novae-zelandiae CBS 107.79]
MRLTSILSILAFGFAVGEVAAEDCFANSNATCRQSGYTLFADKNVALTAITKACEAIKCTPGTKPNPDTVFDKVSGYTATLRLGNKCAGIDVWSTEACVALFQSVLGGQCKTNESLPYPEYPPKPWPPVDPVTFPLATISSSCGESEYGSALGFNIDG